MHVDPDARGVLPSWLLCPLLCASAWTAVAPYAFAGAYAVERAAVGPIPAGVVFVLALADWHVWLRRGKPWHDWVVILPLLPAIGAAVWIAIGGLALGLDLSRAEFLGLEVGPGIALLGLLTTTISFHGRHHPGESTAPP